MPIRRDVRPTLRALMLPAPMLRALMLPAPMLRALMLAASVVPAGLAAQQPDPRPPRSPRTATPAVVQGSGQAATPQLITVRPREQLRFDGQLVVPLYYNRTFWPSILAGYDIAMPRAASPAGDAASAPSSKAAPAVPSPPRRAPVRAPR